MRRHSIDVEVVALRQVKAGANTDVPALGRFSLGLATLVRLRRTARDFDIVIAYGSKTLAACALGLAVSRKVWVYRSIGDPAAWIRGRVHRARTGWMLRRARLVIPLYAGAADAMTSLFRVPPSRVVVIPNARDDQYFRPVSADERSAARTRLGLSETGRVVAFVGALSEEKNVGLAVEAVNRCADTTLLIAGDGPERVALESKARSLGSTAMFLGALDDVRSVFAASDVVVLTSRTEGLPGALIEAGLMGIPAVAARVGGVEQIIVDGVTGRVVRSPTVGEIALAVQDVSTRRVELRESVRRHNSQFSWSNVELEWLRVLSGLVQPHRP